MADIGSHFRPYLSALVAFVVGCAVFAYDAAHLAVAYVGHSLFSLTWRPDARTRIHVDSMERELRASTIELTPLGVRFKAFMRRRSEHRLGIGDGFLSGEAGWLAAH